jgi:release factor glutamine methyltransferase
MLFSTNRLSDIKTEAVQQLLALYPEKEALSIVNLLIRHLFGLSRVEQQLQKEKRLSESEMLQFIRAFQRLLKAEPVQYVLGTVSFCGIKIRVNPSVLIPRPETEELVTRMVAENSDLSGNILDIGTGSGCIALALKNACPACQLTAADISTEALTLAAENATDAKLDINFIRCDMLDTQNCADILSKKFQWIVSNPPYVLQSEKKYMEKRVLHYEPELALFVEDTDPLLFYRKIRLLAERILDKNGGIYLELNAATARDVKRLFQTGFFRDVEILKDFRQTERFLRAFRKG